VVLKPLLFCGSAFRNIGKCVLPEEKVRIWTLHPRYLDKQGLVALWREGLLAQAVLLGRTKGYVRHPQLVRFRAQRAPVAAIATYLKVVYEEAKQRGYAFDLGRICGRGMRKRIPETRGQLLYEWSHLMSKIRGRSPEHFNAVNHISMPETHPLFEIIPGDVRDWEKRKPSK
jgi:hypothetical protein